MARDFVCGNFSLVSREEKREWLVSCRTQVKGGVAWYALLVTTVDGAAVKERVLKRFSDFIAL